METTGYITIGLLVFGMLVEIVPVKWSPLGYIGKKINKNLSDKIDSVSSKVSTLETHVDKIEIDAIRNRILSYDALIRKGEHLKQYQYKSIFSDIDLWKNYHNKYDDLNGMIDTAIENIKEAYKKETFD